MGDGTDLGLCDVLGNLRSRAGAPPVIYAWSRDGIELKVRPSTVLTIRNERIVHGCLYQEWQEALEAVGLSEQDAHADS